MASLIVLSREEDFFHEIARGLAICGRLILWNGEDYLRKLLAIIVMMSLFLVILPSAEARTPTHVLVVGVSATGGNLSLVRILGREYTLQMLPKAAQLAVLGHGSQDENLYSHLSMPELVRRMEIALGITIARHIRFDERLIVDIVNRLGGVSIGGQRQNGAQVLAMLNPQANGLHARSLGQLDIARAIVAEALRPTNWLRLPGIVRAVFAGVQTNYTLTAALGLLLQPPTGTEVVFLSNPAIYFEGRYLPQNLPLPIIANGRTLIPLRVVEQISGARVTWNESHRRATVTRGGKTIDVIVGQSTAWVNGIPQSIGVAPQLLSGRTMVPFRFIFEQLGFGVEWLERDYAIEVTMRP